MSATETYAPDTVGFPEGGPPGPGDLAPAGFILFEPLGRGGMGVVYRARDEALGRDVAVKFLRREFTADPRAVARFLAEAQITARLQHPAIPPVYAVGGPGAGRPYIAMKLIQGRTLDRLLADRPAPGHDRGRFVAAFEQVCQAVGYAHSVGVLHRDLKPANIMVGAFGEVQVMDWGLGREAWADDRGPGGTVPGGVLGTPDFMPPEQANGRAADERSDVFGLGAILCVILTGAPPFAGDSAQGSWDAAAKGDVGAALQRIRGSGADPELIDLATRCLAADPARRPADGGVVAKTVAKYLTTTEERLRQAAADKQRRRTRQTAAAGALTVTGLVGGWVVYHRGVGVERAERAAAVATERSIAQRAVESSIASAYAHADAFRWPEARAAVAGAEARLAEADGWPEDLAAAVKQARKDADVGFALHDVRQHRNRLDGRSLGFDKTYYATGFRDAMTAYGVPVLELTDDEAVRRVRASRVAAALIGGLDEWAINVPNVAGTVQKLQGIAAAADADPWRTRWRALPPVPEAAECLTLLADPAAARQPPYFGVILHERIRDGTAGHAVAEAAARVYPNDYWAAFTLGARALDSSRRPDPAPADRTRWAATAATQLRAVAARWPKNEYTYPILGYALADLGDRTGHETAARDLLRLTPNHAHAHYELGAALSAQHRHAEAVDSYRRCADRDPKHAMARSNIGHYLLLERHDPAGAAAFFQQVGELEPQWYLEAERLGCARLQAGDLTGAEAAFRRTLELNRGNWGADAGIAVVRELRGDYTTARDAAGAALAGVPSYAPLRHTLGTVLLARGDYAAAEQELRRVTEEWPGVPAALTNLAAAGARAAVADRFDLLAAAGGRPSDPLNAAAVALARGRFDLAVAWYRAAFDADPAAEAGFVLGPDLGRLPGGDKSKIVFGVKQTYRTAAALAAVGYGAARTTRARLGPDEWAALHTLARRWLTDEVRAARDEAQKTADPWSKQLHAFRIIRLQHHAGLAPARDPGAIAKMPADDRAAWTAVWKEAETARLDIMAAMQRK